MKKTRNMFICMCTLMLVFVLGTGSVFAEEQNISVLLNNSEPISFDVKPVVQEGRTLVPIKAIANAIGFSVEWEATTEKVYCVGEAMYCTELTIGKKEALRYQLVPDETNMEQKYSEMQVSGDIVSVTMDVPAKTISGRTLVPLRFLSENFGCEVQWDGYLNKINLVTDTENPDCYMEISTAPPQPITPEKVTVYKVGDNVSLIDLGTNFLGEVKAIKGAKLQVYWYDVTDWNGRSIGHRYSKGQSGGFFNNAKFQETTWVESEDVEKQD